MSYGLLTSGLASPETYFLGLIALGLGGMALVAWRGWPTQSSAPGAEARAGVEATSLQLDKEAAAILRLVKAYVDAGERYSVSLAQAGRNLSTLATSDEVGVIVRFLIAENAKMQFEAGDLRAKLEQSQSQIEKLRSNLAEAQEVGLRDPLTALSNRRGFDAKLAREIADAKSHAAAMCLVLGDIDNFKAINDAFGHVMGDEILKLVARVLEENVRSRDTVARYGGEEFAVILPQTELEAATHLTERVRSLLEAKRLVVNESNREIGKITASFGIAELREGDDAETLIQRADARLYQAKRAGRNRVAAGGVVAA